MRSNTVVAATESDEVKESSTRYYLCVNDLGLLTFFITLKYIQTLVVQKSCVSQISQTRHAQLNKSASVKFYLYV